MDPSERYRLAVEALNRSDWPRAQSLALALLGDAPQHAGVHFVAGVASLQLQQMPLAMERLRSAVVLNPARPDYLAQFARGLATGRMFREALVAADRAMVLAPGDALTLDTLGIVFTQTNEHRRAADAFSRAVAIAGANPSYRFNLATSLTFIGDHAGAEAQYEQCLLLAPHYWKVHLALAQLRRHGPDDHHVDRLRRLLENQALPRDARMYLNLALARELEDLGEYAEAFGHLVAGKAAGREGRGDSHARDVALFDAIREAFPEPMAAPGGGADSDEPIFVFGMPRSGTTLVERILSSHPRVLGCGELQNFGVALKRGSGSTTRAILDVDTIMRARDADLSAVGASYVASTRPQTGRLPHFVDKLPHNFLYAGFIARALPNARIVCIRRDPLDTCLGNFRQLFALSSPFYDYSFDLLDTGRYYLMFDSLMKHWQEVLPGRIHTLHYEALVDDQAAQTRALLEHCGLPWDDDCLAFHANPSPVATASTVQVREPLNRRSLGRWRRYEHELTPLRKLLTGAGIEC